MKRLEQVDVRFASEVQAMPPSKVALIGTYVKLEHKNIDL